MSRPSNPSKPVLCYVTDRRSLPAASASASIDLTPLLLQRVEAAASAGVDWIQLREKDLSANKLFRVASECLKRVRAIHRATRILLNDRLDVALSSGADGVHLAENSLPVAEVLRLRDDFFSRNPRRDFLVGASCHSLDAAITAARAGADYIFFGPVFETPSKIAYGPPQGLELLRKVCGAIDIPVLAIGGITSANLADCLAAGAAGIAAIRLFQDSAAPAGRLRDLGT